MAEGTDLSIPEVLGAKEEDAAVVAVTPKESEVLVV